MAKRIATTTKTRAPRSPLAATRQDTFWLRGSIMAATDVSSPLARKKLPKHIRHTASSKKAALLARNRSTSRELFTARSVDETYREWLQRNQETSLLGLWASWGLTTLSVYQAFSHIYFNWSGILLDPDDWITGSICW